jgi:hypothetical protein
MAFVAFDGHYLLSHRRNASRCKDGFRRSDAGFDAAGNLFLTAERVNPRALEIGVAKKEGPNNRVEPFLTLL